MKKKITAKVLSLPPYISTSWTQIEALRMEKNTLLVSFKEGGEVQVPGLTEEELEAIFQAHSQFLENVDISSPSPSISGSEDQDALFRPEMISEALKKMSKLFTSASAQEGENTTALPLQFGFGEGIEGMAAAMQHDPSQSNSPDLPPEILEKIAAIAQVLGKEDSIVVPEPELHCNCFHCQVARTIQQALGQEVPADEQEAIDEEVTEEDLKFRIWDIKQESEKVYIVTNPLDKNEIYHVYLGNPLGCTCGKNNCEHIRAVLES